MWTLRQKAQPAFRVTAAAVMSLWLMATVACAMHCAGLLRTATSGAGSCCLRAASSPSASATGTSSRHHSRTHPSGTGSSGCLKEYVAGKPARLAAPQALSPRRPSGRRRSWWNHPSPPPSSPALTSICDTVLPRSSSGAGCARSFRLLAWPDVVRAASRRDHIPRRYPRGLLSPDAFLPFGASLGDAVKKRNLRGQHRARCKYF